jgi:hypothetical protein
LRNLNQERRGGMGTQNLINAITSRLSQSDRLITLDTKLGPDIKNQESNNSMILLRGIISKLDRSRCTHDLVLSKIQHQQIGTTAVMASAMGMGATGASLIAMAGNSDEEADWVEFELDGKHLKGWFWMIPMRNGDSVEVVAEHIENSHYIAYAVKRESDGLLAVYPHATAGRKAHYRKSINSWMWCSILICLIPIIFIVMPEGWDSLLDTNMQLGLLIGFAIWIVFSATIAFRASEKLMGFVRIAEIIFETFGWPDVENIDLRQTSRESRRENKLANFGNLYFRYK